MIQIRNHFPWLRYEVLEHSMEKIMLENKETDPESWETI